jgi:IMP cyclohydrolase
VNTEAFTVADDTLDRHLRQNSYPGRGLVVGRSSVEDAWLFVYWIMGRSAHSQNRRFVADESVLRTEPVDPSLVQDPSLIIYEAMLELPRLYLVSNGDQTRTIYETLQAGGTFDDALATREREPDPPNYTPRISAMLDLCRAPGALALSLLKANRANPERTDRYTYRPALPPPGLGYGLTTYMGDGSPLPSFVGDPLILPLKGTAPTVLETYWQALNADNRVALAVKHISQAGESKLLVRNRFE